MRRAVVALVASSFLASAAFAQDAGPAAGKLSPDRRFGRGGVVRAIRAGGESLTSLLRVAVDAENRVVVVGTEIVRGSPHRDTEVYAVRVARLSPDGRLDRTFGGDGLVSLPVASRFVAGLAIDGLGGITVTGSFHPAGLGEYLDGPKSVAVRLAPDGAMDTSFAGDGVLDATDVFGEEVPLGGVRASPVDGSVVASAYVGPGGGEHLVLVKILGDGTLDPAFGDGGRLDVGQAGGDWAIDAKGRVLFALTDQSSGPGDDSRVVRLLADGSEDPEFGTFGRLVSGGINVLRGDEIEIDRLGRIVVVGREARDIRAVYRFTADGQTDASFGNGGRAPASFGVPGNTLIVGTPKLALARDADRYAFASVAFFLAPGSGRRTGGGFFVQGMDAEAPLHIDSLVRRVAGGSYPNSTFQDVAVAADGSAAYVVGSVQIDRTHRAPLFLATDLTRSTPRPLANLVVEWADEPGLVEFLGVTGNLRLRNTGNAAVVNAKVEIYVSTDEFLDSSDELIATMDTGRIRARSESVRAVEVLQFTSRFVEGSRLIAVVNPLATLPELDFADDVAVSLPLVELPAPADR